MEKYSSTRNLDDIEQLIDQLGVATLLAYISDVCDAKSMHIDREWNDRPLAKVWLRVATAVGKLSRSKTVKDLP